MRKRDDTLYKLFYENKGWLGLLVFFGILILGLYATIVYSDRLDSAFAARIEDQLEDNRDTRSLLIDAVKILLTQQLVTGENITGISVVILGSLISLAAAIALTVCTSVAVDRLALRSQILLTRQSRAKAEEARVRQRRKIAGFVGVLVLNILTGLFVAFLGSKLPVY
jgi:hypothetical protein